MPKEKPISSNKLSNERMQEINQLLIEGGKKVVEKYSAQFKKITFPPKSHSEIFAEANEKNYLIYTLEIPMPEKYKTMEEKQKFLDDLKLHLREKYGWQNQSFENFYVQPAPSVVKSDNWRNVENTAEFTRKKQTLFAYVIPEDRKEGDVTIIRTSAGNLCDKLQNEILKLLDKEKQKNTTQSMPSDLDPGQEPLRKKQKTSSLGMMQEFAPKNPLQLLQQMIVSVQLENEKLKKQIDEKMLALRPAINLEKTKLRSLKAKDFKNSQEKIEQEKKYIAENDLLISLKELKNERNELELALLQEQNFKDPLPILTAQMRSANLSQRIEATRAGNEKLKKLIKEKKELNKTLMQPEENITEKQKNDEIVNLLKELKNLKNEHNLLELILEQPVDPKKEALGELGFENEEEFKEELENQEIEQNKLKK